MPYCQGGSEECPANIYAKYNGVPMPMPDQNQQGYQYEYNGRPCYTDRGNDQPPGTNVCGHCPPCPAPCNPNAPKTPLEKEIIRLKIAYNNLEEQFRTKVTECAILRTEGAQQRENLEKEKNTTKDLQGRVRNLEMKLEGLSSDTNKFLGTKEQALQQELNMRTLKRCYKEAREEIDELRQLVKEQAEQIEDYRVKYMQSQQLVEEQKKQIETMDMDNQRISEQINYEIQRVKIKFQEKLQELAPLPELLKAAQVRLKEAQQNQMIAEHNAASLARELHVCREKIHSMMINIKSVDKPQVGDKMNLGELQQIQMLSSKVATLQESNALLKNEVERLKATVIRLEQSQLSTEKQLQEKMHECAQLGGELDNVRDEASRSLARANERAETLKRCMHEQIAELERQLARSRGQVATYMKEKECIRRRMQMQVNDASENLARAQQRLRDVEEKALRRLSVESDEDEEICECHKVLTQG